MSHVSVLLEESLAALHLQKGMTVVDGTFGFGGHSTAIAKAIGMEGQLIAFDADESVFAKDKGSTHVKELERLTRFTSVPENFRHIGEALKRLHVERIDGALFDLGLSSTQLEVSGRGFSFQKDEPLLMTFKETPDKSDVTAEVIVNEWSKETLTTILSGFGDERYAWWRAHDRPSDASRGSARIDRRPS